MFTLFYTSVWFTSSILISVMYRTAGHYFHFNGLVTAASLLLQGSLVCLYQQRLPKFPDFTNLKFTGVILSQSFYIFVANLSLQYVPIYIAVIFKCFVPLFNAVINTNSNSSSNSLRHTVLNSVVLSIGMFLSVFKDQSLHFTTTEIIGYILCLLACFFNVIRFAFIKRYFVSIQNNTLDYISDTYIIMAFVLTPFGFLSSSFGGENSLLYFSMFTGIGTVLGITLTVGELKVISKNSVYFTTLLEILKETILLVGSGLIENKLDLINWVGILLVVTSILNTTKLDVEIQEEEVGLLNE